MMIVMLIITMAMMTIDNEQVMIAPLGRGKLKIHHDEGNNDNDDVEGDDDYTGDDDNDVD